MRGDVQRGHSSCRLVASTPDCSPSGRTTCGAATLALASGVEINVVQDMVGHSTISTRYTYSSVLRQIARSAAEPTAGMVPRALVPRALPERPAVLSGVASSSPPGDTVFKRSNQP